MDLHIGDIHLVEGGRPLPFSRQGVVRVFEESEVPVSLNLNLGMATATAWGCEQSEDFVTIHSHYTS